MTNSFNDTPQKVYKSFRESIQYSVYGKSKEQFLHALESVIDSVDLEGYTVTNIEIGLDREPYEDNSYYPVVEIRAERMETDSDIEIRRDRFNKEQAYRLNQFNKLKKELGL